MSVIAGGRLFTEHASLAAMLNAQNSSRMTNDIERNSSQTTMKILAEQTGGKAFMNGNGLAKVIRQVSETSGDFYSLSYTPANRKMDGTCRPIEVRVAGNYKLPYRRLRPAVAPRRRHGNSARRRAAGAGGAQSHAAR
jgi:VWFA-related protein